MMPEVSITLLCVIVAGLAFDFVNGFHDASNSIATIVATRVLKPRQAVAWAAVFNVGAIFFLSTGVAKTMGSGLVALEAVTLSVILCGLIGATLWGLVTWRLGLPSSSSHALMGGYAGAAMAHSAMLNGWAAAGDPILASGWIKVLAFIAIAPAMGFFLSWTFMKTLAFLKSKKSLTPKAATYKKLQLGSSAFLSLMHGSNDAQKTAGIITGALVASGNLPSFDIPLWVLVVSYGTMGLGTLFGGWRIIKTMGMRLTKLDAQGGVCAEGAAACSVMMATLFSLPVSTTHATTGAIIGVGHASTSGKVHWSVGRSIAWSWIVTIPAAALIGGGALFVLSLLSLAE